MGIRGWHSERIKTLFCPSLCFLCSMGDLLSGWERVGEWDVTPTQTTHATVWKPQVDMQFHLLPWLISIPGFFRKEGW